MKPWRLVVSGPGTGSFNMALDEAILRCLVPGAPPTLRLYGWSEPCLSVGYFQSVEKDIDLEACSRLGIGVVRRPTGGRAILHHEELTYSVAGGLDHPLLCGSVNESYGKIAACILAGLRVLGVEVDQAGSSEGPRGKAKSGACFESVWGHELTVGGRKLVASAQMRRGGVVLQHGSILLSVDPARMACVLRTGDKHATGAVLSRRVTSLSSILGRHVSAEDVALAVRRGFEAVVELEAGQPTEDELVLARRLMAEKYGNPVWNLTRASKGPE